MAGSSQIWLRRTLSSDGMIRVMLYKLTTQNPRSYVKSLLSERPGRAATLYGDRRAADARHACTMQGAVGGSV